MVTDIRSFLNALGLPEILLWLLTFAIVYGILTQAKILHSNATRAIIAMISGFFVLMAVPSATIAVLEKMISNWILLIIGLVVLIVLLEVGGVKAKPKVLEVDKEGKPKLFSAPENIFEAYGKVIAVILILFAVMIFVSAGGLELLGWKGVSFGGISGNALLFLLIVIGAIAWMIYESKEKK